MYPRTDATELLDHEPPPRRRLQRDLERPAVEPTEEPAHGLSVRRRNPRTRDLTGLGIDPLRGDLSPMLIKTHHDRHHAFSSRRTPHTGSVQPDPSHTVGPGRPFVFE